MHIVPSNVDHALARRIHAEFSVRPGADHIASEFALSHLSALLQAVAPTRVLEFGAGIGTITGLLVEHPCGIEHVTATEDHPFCVDQLTNNVVDAHPSRVTLLPGVHDVDASTGRFDLVIFDGEVPDAAFAHLHRGSVAFIEGSRKATRHRLVRALAERGLACEIVDHRPGTRWFAFRMRRNPDTGRRYPKFKIRHRPKGCGIGEVRVATESLGVATP